MMLFRKKQVLQAIKYQLLALALLTLFTMSGCSTDAAQLNTNYSTKTAQEIVEYIVNDIDSDSFSDITAMSEEELLAFMSLQSEDIDDCYGVYESLGMSMAIVIIPSEKGTQNVKASLEKIYSDNYQDANDFLYEYERLVAEGTVVGYELNVHYLIVSVSGKEIESEVREYINAR